MSYKVSTITSFRREAKKLTKKYPSLKNELAALGSVLSANPTAGTALGNNCYKLRVSITYFYVADSTVFLLSIYDKSDQENIPDSQIKALLKLIHD